MSENNQLAGKSSDPKDHIKTMSVKNYVSLAQKCPHMCVCIYRYIYNHFYKSYYRRGLCSPHSFLMFLNVLLIFSLFFMFHLCKKHKDANYMKYFLKNRYFLNIKVILLLFKFINND